MEASLGAHFLEFEGCCILHLGRIAPALWILIHGSVPAL